MQGDSSCERTDKISLQGDSTCERAIVRFLCRVIPAVKGLTVRFLCKAIPAMIGLTSRFPCRAIAPVERTDSMVSMQGDCSW